MAGKRKNRGAPPPRPRRPVKAAIPYRAAVERALLALALFGILLAIHLTMWYGGGAASADPVCGAAFDCDAVIASDPAPLGVSSTVWGLLFYLAAAGTCLAIAYGRAPELLSKVRMGLIGGGFLYSAFLTYYQYLVLSDRCLVCLLSAVTVTAMALVLVWDRWKPHDAVRPRGEWRVHAALGLVFAVLFFVDWQARGDAVVEAQVADETVNTAICSFAPDRPRYENLDRLVTSDDAVLGNPDAPVTVFEFLDPNCNHCKSAHPIMMQLVENYGDRVRFVFKAVTLVGGPSHSLDEAMALALAAEEGEFEGMLDLQFEHQSPPTGLSLDRLTDFADDLGMDEDRFRSRMIDRDMEPRVRGTWRIFEGMNLPGVPAIIVGDRLVGDGSRSVGCISHFIENELEASP